MADPTMAALTPNLMVRSVDETVRFYKDFMGFEVRLAVPNDGPLVWASVQRDNIALMFQERNNLVGEYPTLEDRQENAGFTLFIQVSHIEEFYEKLKNRVTFAKDLGTTFYGMKEFAIEDCNGVILTFAERVQ